MLKDKKICVVLPAYNAAKTLEMTYGEIPMDIGFTNDYLPQK